MIRNIGYSGSTPDPDRILLFSLLRAKLEERRLRVFESEANILAKER